MNRIHLSLFQLLRLSAGLIIWASAFVGLYAGYSLACQQIDLAGDTGPLNPVTGLLVLISGIHLAALVGLLLAHRWRPTKVQPDESERSHRLRHWLECCVLWISLAGLLFITFPVLMVPPCAG